MIKYLLGVATVPVAAAVVAPLFKRQIKAYSIKKTTSIIKNLLFDSPAPVKKSYLPYRRHQNR